MTTMTGWRTLGVSTWSDLSREPASGQNRRQEEREDGGMRWWSGTVCRSVFVSPLTRKLSSGSVSQPVSQSLGRSFRSSCATMATEEELW